MTKIVPTALLAHKAVLAVSRTLNEAGAVAEVIKNDFGEDLIVQTQIDETADSFSILVQVKGSSLKIGKDDLFRFRVSVDHLLRWVSHYQPVLVCIYNDDTGNIYSFLPRDRFSLWKLATTKSQTLTVSLGEGDLFSAENAKSFIWDCRLDYYNRMLAWYEHVQSDLKAFNVVKSGKKIRELEKEKGVVAMDFLKSIGLVVGDTLDAEYVNSVRTCAINFAKRNSEDKKDKMALSHVFLLCLLAHVNRKIGRGLPLTLMSYPADVAGAYFAHLHPDLWGEVCERLEVETRKFAH